MWPKLWSLSAHAMPYRGCQPILTSLFIPCIQNRLIVAHFMVLCFWHIHTCVPIHSSMLRSWIQSEKSLCVWFSVRRPLSKVLETLIDLHVLHESTIQTDATLRHVRHACRVIHKVWLCCAHIVTSRKVGRSSPKIFRGRYPLRPPIMPNFIKIGQTSLEKSVKKRYLFGPSRCLFLSRTETWPQKMLIAASYSLSLSLSLSYTPGQKFRTNRYCSFTNHAPHKYQWWVSMLMLMITVSFYYLCMSLSILPA